MLRHARHKSRLRRPLVLLIGAVAGAAILLAAACGANRSTQESTATPDWAPLRELQVGDCVRPPSLPIGRMPCDDPSWWARVYYIERGPEANVHSCPDPVPPVAAGLTSVFQVNDLLICFILHEPIAGGTAIPVPSPP